MPKSMSSIREEITREHYSDTRWASGPWFHGKIYWSVVGAIEMLGYGIWLLGMWSMSRGRIIYWFVHAGRAYTLYVAIHPLFAALKCQMQGLQYLAQEILRCECGTWLQVHALMFSWVIKLAFAAWRFMEILLYQEAMILQQRYGAFRLDNVCAHCQVISARSTRLPLTDTESQQVVWIRVSGYGIRMTGMASSATLCALGRRGWPVDLVVRVKLSFRGTPLWSVNFRCVVIRLWQEALMVLFACGHSSPTPPFIVSRPMTTVSLLYNLMMPGLSAAAAMEGSRSGIPKREHRSES